MRRSGFALALLVSWTWTAAAAPETPRVERLAGVERVESSLGGALVAALAPGPGGDLYVLVRPEEDPDGPRRLLRITGGEAPRLEVFAESLGGWTKALAALDLGRGPELVAAGLGRLAALGPLASPTGAERTLLEHPGFDLRSLHPSRLRLGIARDVVAAEVGALRVWRPDAAAGLELAADVGLPFTVERRSAGLRLAGPPVVELAPDSAGRRRFAVGPEVRGASRLRVLRIAETADAGWTTTELWAALPAPETVEESWIADGDDGPVLVVRSQGALALNAFENQLWRLFRLGPDRTRAGRSPALAVSVDSKRWHDNQALVADADGDGRVDLLLARPEGMTGGDLVVERYAGLGEGRFDRRSRRTDLDDAPPRFAWLADVDGSGRPGLATLVGGELVVWRTAREGRRALERQALLRVPLAAGGGDAVFEWLGAVPRAGLPPELLVVAVLEQGESRLIQVRATAR
jgi:hypothetical protein